MWFLNFNTCQNTPPPSDTHPPLVQFLWIDKLSPYITPDPVLLTTKYLVMRLRCVYDVSWFVIVLCSLHGDLFLAPGSQLTGKVLSPVVIILDSLFNPLSPPLFLRLLLGNCIIPLMDRVDLCNHNCVFRFWFRLDFVQMYKYLYLLSRVKGTWRWHTLQMKKRFKCYRKVTFHQW